MSNEGKDSGIDANIDDPISRIGNRFFVMGNIMEQLDKISGAHS